MSVRRVAALSDSEGSERGTITRKRPSSDVLDSSDAVSHPKKLAKSKKPAAALGLAPEEGEEIDWSKKMALELAPEEGEECGADPQKKPAAPEEGEERGDDPQKKPAAALEEGKECGDDGSKTPKICLEA